MEVSHDVVEEILCHLGGRDLIICHCVCKSWKKILENDNFWKKLYQKDYKDVIFGETVQNISWKIKYKMAASGSPKILN